MKKLSTFLLFIIFLLTGSCELGLGASVDTDPPALEIKTPPVDAVIRDTFAISGTYKDDGTIAKVSAKLKRTDGKKSDIEIAGSFSQDIINRGQGTWKILVNPIKQNEDGTKNTLILDGTYQATVTIKDATGRTTTQNTTFTIDNTPPVLLLERPSVKAGDAGFDAYGRTFTIEGKAADDNEVSKIEVNIFENADSETPIFSEPIKLTDIDLNVQKDVAIFEQNVQNVYAEIYGATAEPNAAERYCTLRIFDGAKKYPLDGSEAIDVGNSTDYYYMNSIKSKFSETYNVTDLYHIQNGTINLKSDRNVDINAEREVLNNAENKVEKSKFSINPANNPRYRVSSAVVLSDNKKLDDVDYQLTAGNRYLEIEIEPGLDNNDIDSDSIGVYFEPCDVNGTKIEGKEPVLIIATGSENHIFEVDSNESIERPKGIVTKTGKNYKFKTPKVIDSVNYPGLNTGNYYKVVVQGYDSQGEGSGSIISDGIYAFKLIASGEKIELTAVCEPVYISKIQSEAT